jgi:tocopherol O-methyltransferase
LFEKAQFFERAADWLRPGGRVAICAWLAGQTCGDPVLEQQVHEVCEGFLCPSLGTSQDYVAWLQNAGLEVQTVEDWTPHVARTWEICQRRVRRSGIQRVAPWIDGDTVMFLNRFDTILNAYRSGAMQYGCFVAQKPSI